MMDKRKAYEEKLEAQLDEWSAQVALFRARADKASAAAKIEYCRITEELQRRHDATRARLLELKGAGDESWKGLKNSAERVWAEVKTAFTDAASRLK